MKLNLLLADDDITTVNHLQEIIERELASQFSIFTASDGLMALKRLKETKIHIVISDIRMPGCDAGKRHRERPLQYPRLRGERGRQELR